MEAADSGVTELFSRTPFTVGASEGQTLVMQRIGPNKCISCGKEGTCTGQLLERSLTGVLVLEVERVAFLVFGSGAH